MAETLVDGHAARVAFFVTGGIAAYKACEVLRGLQKQGCEVRVAMTAHACELVGPEDVRGPLGPSRHARPLR